MEMLDGISKWPPFVATIGKSSRNSYSSYRIQAVCILTILPSKVSGCFPRFLLKETALITRQISSICPLRKSEPP